jgi:CRP-like cAMP-binding protein
MVETNVLAGIPLFAALDEFDLRKIAAWFELRDVSEGVELIGEGAPGYKFFLIAEGRAEVRSGDVAVAEFGPGDFFGEGAIVGGGRRNASVVVTSPSQVLVMFGTEFRRLEQSYPDVATQIKTAARERFASEPR